MGRSGQGISRRKVIVVMGGAVLGVLPLFFRHLYWTRGFAGEYYVPGSAPHSVLSVSSVLGAMMTAHFLLLPTAPSRQGEK